MPKTYQAVGLRRGPGDLLFYDFGCPCHQTSDKDEAIAKGAELAPDWAQVDVSQVFKTKPHTLLARWSNGVRIQ